MSTAFARLARTLADLEQPAAIERFLLEVMTPGEVHDLGLRWELVELLVEGVSQRQIASRLGISLCKITRGAKILKKKNGVVSGVFAKKPPAAKKTPAAKTAPKSVKTAAAKPVRTDAPKSAKAGAAKAGAPAPAKKPVKKVVEKHGTRVPGKSKNQVRR